ncbi:propanediol utilization microcompartment protein PduB [Clostridium luticellarii]|jgi:microcompartment protein PduB|uniref:Propanediol utilization protein PduB n=1 Tax=Clostridium luticellarii TaxID=1691940 RepID=A0A2T0BPB9_9CLOT|nr:propanediol utilization microcompartment protein PduB [Clostridium luticellarii]MCI1945028.1 propanediol utilization microcompartment protein PduB [Clostridium luticellarii]MCI1967573.1 propanediol utilization microcompartment protein PduB [Clostridium luticellarii]MCI1995729.1 propanediol utilization microcompartment protein PduB [Clostridium luticellarii]MCI2040067.1 propanediol utilization microcompartment protein PduB [Clostridium luticellarii]PRR85728.1 Propanediol utilization protein 
MDNELIEKVLEEIRKKVDLKNISKDQLNEIVKSSSENLISRQNKENNNKKEVDLMSAPSPITEFVGTANYGDTVGLVIANVDSLLHEKMGIDAKYRSIGIISDRTGAGPQIMAADEAVKATNTEVISIELPRDTKGGAGHGSLIILASEDVSDSRRAVEVALKDTDRTFGDVYGFDAGHVELHYTARASLALNKAFGAPIGKSFGIIVGAPAGLGVVMADTALKTANVDLVSYSSPSNGTSYSNEVIITVTGDSGAVRQSVIAAREVGLSIARSMGQNPVSTTGKPYI